MKLVSAPVLGAAAVLTGPSLWAAFVAGQMPTDTALLRYAVAAVLTWLALSAFTAMVGEAPRPEPAATDPADQFAAHPAARPAGDHTSSAVDDVATRA